MRAKEIRKQEWANWKNRSVTDLTWIWDYCVISDLRNALGKVWTNERKITKTSVLWPHRDPENLRRRQCLRSDGLIQSKIITRLSIFIHISFNMNVKIQSHVSHQGERAGISSSSSSSSSSFHEVWASIGYLEAHYSDVCVCVRESVCVCVRVCAWQEITFLTKICISYHWRTS